MSRTRVRRPRRVLVVHAHPRPGSFSHAQRDRVVATLEAAGHHVDVVDLHAEGFDPVLNEAEWRGHLADPATKPEIAGHARLLQAADTLVLVHPTWYSSQPAILKGWFDRVWVSGVAYDLPEGASRIRPRLRGIRRIAVVTTHGSPKWVNVLQGEVGKLLVQRQLRLLCSRRCRFAWIALYGVDRADDAARGAFCDRVGRRIAAFVG